MMQYVVRRLLLSLTTLALVSVIVFSSVRMMPGDIVTLLLEGSGYDPAQAEQLEEELGLNRPAYQQYFVWLSDVLRGDLGASLWSGEPVSELIQDRLVITLKLAVVTTLFAVAIGVPVGVVSAIKQDLPLDYGLRTLAIVAISVPYFWIATLVIALPARWWGWTPPIMQGQAGIAPWDDLKVLLLPSIILGVNLSGASMRIARSAMLEVLRLDYIRTARAKGVSRSGVVLRHALRNALIPIITVIGLQFALLLGGSVIIESLFAIPGVGRLMVDSLTVRDYSVIQGITLTFAAILVVINLSVDLLYGVVDARIRE